MRLPCCLGVKLLYSAAVSATLASTLYVPAFAVPGIVISKMSVTDLNMVFGMILFSALNSCCVSFLNLFKASAPRPLKATVLKFLLNLRSFLLISSIFY